MAFLQSTLLLGAYGSSLISERKSNNILMPSLSYGTYPNSSSIKIDALLSLLLNESSFPACIFADNVFTRDAVLKKRTGISLLQAIRPMQIESIVLPVPVPPYIMMFLWSRRNCSDRRFSMVQSSGNSTSSVRN